jgi:hypothetical protein
MKLYLYLAAALLLIFPAMAAPVVLTATQDTDIYQFTTYPTSTTYSLGVNASNHGGHSQKSLVKFEISASALGMVATQIQSAKLRLYVLPDSSTGSGFGGTLVPGNVSVFPQGNPWTVATARWSSFAPGAFISTLSITQASTENTPVWVEADVTETVKSWVAEITANHGFILQSSSETTTPLLSVLFASMETGFPPQLVIREVGSPPALVVTQPLLTINRKFTKTLRQKSIILRGTTSDPDGIAKVQYRIGKGPLKLATGTTAWSFKTKLKKGKTKITVFATDVDGIASLSQVIKIKRK